jgi:hypothetical protein
MRERLCDFRAVWFTFRMPPLYDFVWSITAILLIAVVVIALVSIVRQSAHLSPLASVAWAAVVVFLPVLGPIAWFVLGRPSSRGRSAASTL